MADTKAPGSRQVPGPESESWSKLPWRKLEQHVSRLQKRIFRAGQRGNKRAVHKLQKLLMKSRAARLVAVRRVTQDNQGKRTAGRDRIPSVRPTQRFALVDRLHPQRGARRKPQPGKDEQRPLALPVMLDHAYQYLVKQALEPEWEAKFEAQSYGFRPGRSCHDALAALSMQINTKACYVLSVDLQGCFANMAHEVLLSRLQTYPAMKRIVRAWLKAGVMEHGVCAETAASQSGVVTPLLANIAFHGMETALNTACAYREGKPTLVRYAYDCVVFHPTEQGIVQARAVLEQWIKDSGLEMKPGTTRISHTLQAYQGNVGFDFLEWTVRQFPVGKTHAGNITRLDQRPGFKTIIRPGKEAEKRHMAEIKEVLRKNLNVSQGQLIRELNPVIQRWTRSHRTVRAADTLSRCRKKLFLHLQEWGRRRHPNKGMHWIAERYWHVKEGDGRTFTDGKSTLRTYTLTRTTVQKTARPYDGDSGARDAENIRNGGGKN